MCGRAKLLRVSAISALSSVQIRLAWHRDLAASNEVTLQSLARWRLKRGRTVQKGGLRLVCHAEGKYLQDRPRFQERDKAAL